MASTKDYYVLDVLRPGEVYVAGAKYVAPSEFQNWGDEYVCQD